jgi:hypothetical protein
LKAPRAARSVSADGELANVVTALLSAALVVTTAAVSGTTTSCTSAVRTASRVGGGFVQLVASSEPAKHWTKNSRRSML